MEQQQCECKNEDNEDVEFIGFCQNEECQEDLFCEKCKGIHDNHQDDLLMGEEFNQFLEEYNSPEYLKKIEQEQLIIEFQQYYDNIQNENIEETNMLTEIQSLFKQNKFQEVVKLLDKIKKCKEEFDNNKPAQIQKKMNEYRSQLKELDNKYPSGDNEAREKKLQLIREGRQLFHEQVYYEAHLKLEQALQIDNDCIDALLLKSQSLIQLENFQKAITSCDEIIQRDRQNCEAYFIKIIALLLRQNYDTALEELQKANHKASYKFYCNIINLIKYLEINSATIKQTLTELNFDLKESLQSLILFQEVPAQMQKQQLTQLIEIIKLADQNEIDQALYQYNLNFEVIEEYQKQYEVDLRPNLDEESWKQMIEYLESQQKILNNNQAEVQLNQEQPTQENLVQQYHLNNKIQIQIKQYKDNQINCFLYYFNDRIKENVPTDNTIQSQNNDNSQITSNSITAQTPNQIVNQLNDFLQDDKTNQNPSNVQQQQTQSQNPANQITTQPPNQIVDQLNDFLQDKQPNQNPQNTQNEQQQQTQNQTPSNQITAQPPNQIADQLNDFLQDDKTSKNPSNEQQQQRTQSQTPSNQITAQTPNQIADQLNDFLQDDKTNQNPSNVQQQQTQSQNPANQITAQPPNQFIDQFNDFVKNEHAKQITPNEAQQNQSQQQLPKEIPTAKIQQDLENFYKDPPQKQNIQPQQQVQQPITPQIQQDLNNFMNEQQQAQPKVREEGINKETIALNEAKRQEEILKYCDEMIGQNQDVCQYYYKKAMSLKKLNYLEDALQNFDEAININPNEANYYFQKAQLLLSLGHSSLALSSFDEAIQINPAEARYYQEKGNALQKCNRQNEAQQCFEFARQLNNGDQQ